MVIRTCLPRDLGYTGLNLSRAVPETHRRLAQGAAILRFALSRPAGSLSNATVLLIELSVVALADDALLPLPVTIHNIRCEGLRSQSCGARRLNACSSHPVPVALLRLRASSVSFIDAVQDASRHS